MKELIAYLDSRQGDMLALLERMVNTDSGTLDKAGVDRVGALLAERLAGLGFGVEVVRQREYGDHLVGRKAGQGSRRILFVGHMDTVFAAGTAAQRPFRIEAGRAYGPGVLDMKGGIVCLLFALEALRATKHPAYEAAAMGVVFNSDEEYLSPTSRPLIEEEARRSQTVCVFEPARPGGEYVIGRKGTGKYRLTVTGRAAHAGAQPERGRSAIGEMAHKIVALHGLTDFSTGATVNVGVVRGGERSNVVAEKAYAEIDIRVPSLEVYARLDERIKAIASGSTVPDTTAVLEGGLVFPPMIQTPGAKALFEALRAAGRVVGVEVKGIHTGGGSDGNYASQFAPTLDGMGPQGSETHSDREFIEVPTLLERSKVTALFLAGWPETVARLDS
jgi:glutamate carboxypeptidase